MLDAANVRRMVEDAAIMDESNTKEKHTIKGRHNGVYQGAFSEVDLVGAGRASGLT
jgi:hypothetical protein